MQHQITAVTGGLDKPPLALLSLSSRSTIASATKATAGSPLQGVVLSRSKSFLLASLNYNYDRSCSPS